MVVEDELDDLRRIAPTYIMYYARAKMRLLIVVQ